MPPTDNTVSIVIRVVDEGSGAISNVETKLAGLGATGVASSAKVAGMSGQLKEVGAAGAGLPHPLVPPIPPEIPEQLNKTTGHMRELSGVSREMGLNMGYSMRSFLAQSPAAIAALQAMSSMFIAMAAIEIGVQLIEGVVHLYEKWFDVTKEVEAYQQKAAEAADMKLFDTASLETTSALLSQIGDQIDQLNAKKKAAGADLPAGGLLQYFGGAGAFSGMGHVAVGITQGPPAFTAANDKELAELYAQRDKLDDHAIVGAQKVQAERDKGQAAYDSAVGQGYAKIASHERDAITEINHRYDAMQEREENLIARHNAGYDIAKAAGKNMTGMYRMAPADTEQYKRERGAAIGAVQQESAGQYAAAGRSENERIISAQNAAIDAGATGEVLQSEKRQQEIDKVLRDGALSDRAQKAITAAIDMKYHNEKMRRLQEEQYQTSRIQQEAAQAGLTGMAKIKAEGQGQVRDLTEDPAKEALRSTLGQAGVQQRVAAVNAGTDARIQESRKQFQQEMDQIAQRSDAQMQTGYARIEATAQGAKTRAGEDFTNFAGQLPKDDPERIAAEQRAQAAIGIVQQNAERERLQLTQRDNQEIAKINSETAQASLPPWLAAQQRIRAQYDETRQHAQADLEAQLSYFKGLAQQSTGLTSEQAAAQAQVWNQYYQRVSAEAGRANAEMQRQSEQTRDQLAGQLSSFFDNPAKYMEDRAKQLMMDIVANWVMQLAEAKGPMGSAMAWMFGMGPEMSTSTNPKTALGSIFGSHTAAHGTAGAIGGSHTLDVAGSTLSSAGSTLSSAGPTLSSSGTMLATAADALRSAAAEIGSMNTGGGAGAGVQPPQMAFAPPQGAEIKLSQDYLQALMRQAQINPMQFARTIEGRHLTQSEIEDYSQVMGSRPDWANIKVHENAPFATSLTNQLGGKDIWMAANIERGNDYYKEILAHELVHTTQPPSIHNDRNYSMSGELLDEVAGQKKSFYDLGVEQQAMAVEDYYRMKHLGGDRAKAAQRELPSYEPFVQEFRAGPPTMWDRVSKLFGANSATGMAFAPHPQIAGMQDSTLISAASTLSSAGSTLSSSGTMLVSAADALRSAAAEISGMNTGGGAGASASGVLGGGGGVSMGPTQDLADTIASGTAQASGALQSSGGIAAPTGASGVPGTPSGAAPSAGAIGQSVATLGSLVPGGGAISGGASLFSELANGGLFGSTAQHIMGGTPLPGAVTTSGTGGTAIPSAGVQSPDIFEPPGFGFGDTSGVSGAGGDFSGAGLSSEGFGFGDTSSQNGGADMSGGSGGSSGIGAMGIAGAGMAGISGGMAMLKDWRSGNTGGAVLTGAMTGAAIGGMFGGPIGMAIGAAAGALVGFIGGLFGDAGAGKARTYNEGTIKPDIQKEMTSYTAAQVGYDQATQDLTSLQMQAQAQTKAWGSGAVGVYKHDIAPEFAIAIAEIERQQDTGRAGAIEMQVAQYDSGGIVTSFGDFSTGPFSGYIHARLGERVMDPMTSMVHGPALQAMSRGVDPSAFMPRGSGSGMGASGGGGGGDVHLHVHTIDAQDTARWLRTTGAAQIQSALNSNVNRYAGKSLG